MLCQVSMQNSFHCDVAIYNVISHFIMDGTLIFHCRMAMLVICDLRMDGTVICHWRIVGSVISRFMRRLQQGQLIWPQ